MSRERAKPGAGELPGRVPLMGCEMSLRTIPEPPNSNTSPPAEKRPARLRPITTIRPGEFVRITLRGKHAGSLNGWAGRVLAVDGVALRIAADARRFDWYWDRATGETVIPWSRVDAIAVQDER